MTGKCDESNCDCVIGEHNLSIIKLGIMTQWGKHKTVILLALKHNIIEKTWSIVCSSLVLGQTSQEKEGQCHSFS